MICAGWMETAEGNGILYIGGRSPVGWESGGVGEGQGKARKVNEWHARKEIEFENHRFSSNCSWVGRVALIAGWRKPNSGLGDWLQRGSLACHWATRIGG